MNEQPTRVPEVRDELFARCTTAMTEWQVFDGPPGQTSYDPNVLVIGHQGLSSGLSVESEVTRQEGLGHRLREEFEISCILSTHAGDTSAFAALRQTLHAGLEQVEQILKADVGLGGICDALTFGPSMNWMEESNQNGSTAEVLFSIVGRALL